MGYFLPSFQIGFYFFQISNHTCIDTDSTGKRVYKGKIYATLRSALRFGLAHRLSFVFAMTGLLLLSVFGYQYMRPGVPPMEVVTWVISSRPFR